MGEDGPSTKPTEEVASGNRLVWEMPFFVCVFIIAAPILWTWKQRVRIAGPGTWTWLNFGSSRTNMCFLLIQTFVGGSHGKSNKKKNSVELLSQGNPDLALIPTPEALCLDVPAFCFWDLKNIVGPSFRPEVLIFFNRIGWGKWEFSPFLSPSFPGRRNQLSLDKVWAF